MSKFKRVMKMIVKIILALIFVLVLAVVIVRFVGKRQLDAQIDALKAKGEPVTMADLFRDEIPDDQNAAVIYKKISRRMDDPEHKKDIEFLLNLSAKNDSFKDPKMLSDAKNAADRSEWLITELEDAASKPKCQLARDPNNTVIPSYDSTVYMRNIMRVLGSITVIDSRLGKTESVVKNIDLALKVSDSLKDEPTIITQLYRNAMYQISLYNLNLAMENSELNADQSQKLFSAFAKINLMDGFTKAMQGERVMFLHEQPGENGIYPLISIDRAAYIKNSLRLDALHNMSYKEAKYAGKFNMSSKLPRYMTLARVLVPLTERAAMASYKTSAQIACAQTALAISAYKDRFGSYPQSLKELQTKLGWKLPKDPFNGESLVYKLQDKGYLLYSVGPDLKDSGGAELKYRENEAAKGDIVWKMNH